MRPARPAAPHPAPPPALCSAGHGVGERGGEPEGPKQAWQQLRRDLQDPHDWDKMTEQAYERGNEQWQQAAAVGGQPGRSEGQRW